MPTSIDFNRFFLIAGPCVIESQDLCLRVAEHVQKICQKLGIVYIFKASFDKANRSNVSNFRGMGMEAGLGVLAKIKQQLGLPVLTDVHEPDQCAAVGEVVDILQIPAFLARQTDLLQAAGATGRVVNIKKGQFMAPQEMKNAAQKVQSGGKSGPILLTERGTFFGYNRLVNDFTALPIMKELGYPVVFDITHSTQQPAGLGNSSGGNPQYAPILARAAMSAGVDGIFLECHPDPKNALSDAATMLPLSSIEELLTQCKQLDDLRKSW